MDKIIIPIHSFVDIITNSSTEIFVLESNKTLVAIKEILTKLVDDYRWQLEESDQEQYIEDLTFEKTFAEPYIYTQDMYDVDMKQRWKDDYQCSENIGKIILGGFNDNSIPYPIYNIIEQIFNCERYHLG